jgi:hypothetical protein
VYASKPIEAGQEIFISYVDHMKSNKTVETRRQHLYNHYVPFAPNHSPTNSL